MSPEAELPKQEQEQDSCLDSYLDSSSEEEDFASWRKRTCHGYLAIAAAPFDIARLKFIWRREKEEEKEKEKEKGKEKEEEKEP